MEKGRTLTPKPSLSSQLIADHGNFSRMWSVFDMPNAAQTMNAHEEREQMSASSMSHVRNLPWAIKKSAYWYMCQH